MPCGTDSDIAGVFLGAFTNAALAAALPLLIGQAFNAVLHKPILLGELQWAAVMLVVSQVVRAVLQLGRNFWQRGPRAAPGTRHAPRTLRQPDRQEHDVPRPAAVGDVMARATNDVREINLMFNPGVNLVIGSAMFLIMPLHCRAGDTSPADHDAAALFIGYYFVGARLPAPPQSGDRTCKARIRRDERPPGRDRSTASRRSKARRRKMQENRALFDRRARPIAMPSSHQGDLEARFVPSAADGRACRPSACCTHLLLLRAGAHRSRPGDRPITA